MEKSKGSGYPRPNNSNIKILKDIMTMSERIELAMNPNTSIETLIELSKDQSEEVRWGVARNPNTPVETLIKLSRDGSTIVRARVARNLNTPIETLAKLDGDHGVTIVNNPRWKALERAGLIDVALAASKYLGIL